MDPGAYRYSVTIEREIKGQRNEFNERDPNGWVEVEPMRCLITQRKAREVLNNNQTHAEVTHIVRFWKNENVTESCRLRWLDGDKERLLYVASVIDLDHYSLQQEATAIERR
jgi:head-tail adaptor